MEVLGLGGNSGPTNQIALPLDPTSQSQFVHYDQLRLYTPPLLPASLSCSSPPLVPSCLCNGLFRWARVTEDPCGFGGREI